MSRRPLHIAAFSGALGDYVAAFSKAVRGEPVDVVFGDYLAEMTMGRVIEGFSADPAKAQDFYCAVFLKQLEPELQVIAERGLKVVVNAGAFAPAALGEAVRAQVRKHGLALKTAVVDGDNLMPRVQDLARQGQLYNLDTHAPIGDLAGRIVAANGYLGGWGIAAALEGGANIVICGRVTDASMVLGPAAWWHGWKRDDWDPLAGALAAGHILECGPQAMGGNFAGFTELPRAARLGFPIAEIAEDGGAVITKRPGEGGAVTVDTVKAQFMYEIQGARYLNPDVILHVDSVQVTQEGPDRVRVHGVKGSVPPDTTKVGCFYPNGYRILLTAYATGLDIDEKIDWLGRQMGSIVETLNLDDYRYEACGQPKVDPKTQAEATVLIRIAAAAQDKATLQRLLAGFSSFGLGGIPGMHGEAGRIEARVDYWPGVVRQDVLRHTVTYDDGRAIEVSLPPLEPFDEEPFERDGPADADLSVFGETIRAPLGEVVFARVGDKGASADLGVWCRKPQAYAWLAAFLTKDRLVALLGLPEHVIVKRYELANVGGVLFVLEHYFGTSGSGNIGLDQIGKALGEFLRARLVDAPVAFVAQPPPRRAA